MNKVTLNESEFEDAVKRAMELAIHFLTDNENYLDNVLEMNRLGNKLVGKVWDTEFHVFGVIASDTDHLPTNKTRPLCSESMLEKSDAELLGVINCHKTAVANACHEILSKYQNV